MLASPFIPRYAPQLAEEISFTHWNLLPTYPVRKMSDSLLSYFKFRSFKNMNKDNQLFSLSIIITSLLDAVLQEVVLDRLPALRRCQRVLPWAHHDSSLHAWVDSSYMSHISGECDTCLYKITGGSRDSLRTVSLCAHRNTCKLWWPCHMCSDGLQACICVCVFVYIPAAIDLFLPLRAAGQV